jgi:hypothetical protein
VIDDRLRSVDAVIAVRVTGGGRTETWSMRPGERPDASEIVAGIVGAAKRVAHGRRRVGITTGFGEPSPARALAEDLGDIYDVTAIDWDNQPEAVASVDCLIVNGPVHPVSDAARRALDARVVAGRAVLLLVRALAFTPEGAAYVGRVAPHGLDPLLNAWGFNVWPGMIADRHNGLPATLPLGGVEVPAQAYFPLAQVLAGQPSEPLAHLHYVALPFASPVSLTSVAEDPPAVIPLLRFSPLSFNINAPVEITADLRLADPDAPGPGLYGAAAAIGAFHSAFSRASSPPGTRLVVVGDADLVGDEIQETEARLHLEMYGNGFRAVHQLVDWVIVTDPGQGPKVHESP